MFTINKRVLLVLSICYLYIPIIIFLVGFTRPVICLTVLILTGIAAYRFANYLRKGDFENKTLQIKWSVFIGAMVFFLIIGYYAGLGRWTDQPYDWYKHNAILQDLIDHKWPVYYSNSGERSMLTYYIGHYLVSALFGKITGSFRAAARRV